MDLRAYYQKIREIERLIEEEFPIVKSLATEDGGKEGRFVEAPRALAARMIADGMAELSTSKDSEKYRNGVKEQRRKEEERRRAAQVQFTILSESDLKALQRSSRADRKG